jgi:predicted RNase H-like HicB family nuclease
MDEVIINAKEAVELYIESLTAHAEPIRWFVIVLKS